MRTMSLLRRLGRARLRSVAGVTMLASLGVVVCGTAPVVSAEVPVFDTAQGVTGGFRDTTADSGVETMIDLSIVNGNPIAANGIDFVFELPLGIFLSGNSPSSTCGGSLVVTDTDLTLTDGSVPAVRELRDHASSGRQQRYLLDHQRGRSRSPARTTAWAR